MISGAADTQLIARLTDRCREYGCSETAINDIDETCEREVAPEVEDEKQISKPPMPEPADQNKAAGLEFFISTGQLQTGEAGFQWAFRSLQSTSLAEIPELWQFPKNLRVTHNFANTINTFLDTDETLKTDNYQQHVAYVLSIKKCHLRMGVDQVVIIVSQSEVDEHWALLEQSPYVDLHVYNAKVTPETARRRDYILFPPRASQDFSYPDDVRIALDIFAGQLYFGSYGEYMDVCSFLGLLHFSDAPDDLELQPDLFVTKKQRRVLRRDHYSWCCDARGGLDLLSSRFKSSPVPFLKKFLTVVRNHGASIDHTHMGRVLNGERLGMEEFWEGSTISRKRCCAAADCEHAPQPAKKRRTEKNGEGLGLKTSRGVKREREE